MRLPTVLRGPSDPEQRLMAVMTLVNMAGSGLYFAAGTLYLTRSAGMSPAQVGLGLTLGGLCGLVGGVVIGDQADRRGAREVVIVAMLVEAVAACALIAVHSTVALALVAGVAATAGAGNGSGRGALIGLVAKEGEGAKLRSYLRAVTNVGLAVGTLGAALVLALDTREGYVGMLIADALSFVVAAAVVTRLPRRAPTRVAADAAPDDLRWLALRDKPYLALTLSAAVASLQYEVPIVVLPLWVTLHTHAPRWSSAVLFLIAALLVAALQVPATRSIDGPRAAARLVLRSGPVFLVAWALIALSSGAAAGVALALLVVAITIHSLAEVWQAGGMFELSFALAQPEAQGQYQGVFGLSMGITEAVGPVLLIGLCITWGSPGWLVLGAIVTVAGVACARIERWSATRRTATVPV
jgi:Na+/melibiose symporter-like transporter